MVEKENLVFLPDSPYSNWIIDRSEALLPNINQYVCLASSRKYLEFSFITNSNYVKNLSLKQANSFKRIIIHYHNESTAYFLEKNKIPFYKVIWVLWSGDLYNTPFYSKPIYQPITNKLTYVYNNRFNKKIKEIIKGLLKREGTVLHRKSFKRIKFIASPFEKDVLEARNLFSQDFVHIPFAFLSVDELFDRDLLQDLEVNGNKILIGHSGVPEGNHLEAFDIIKKFKINHIILCPLSYGNLDYINEIRTKGNTIFGTRFEPIMDFLPKKEYYNMLSQVGFAIFNNNVQQGFGNVLGLIFLGVKVFLNPSNSIYFQFKQWGIVVYNLEELTEEDLLNPLSSDQITLNKKIIIDKFNENALNEFYKGLYEIVV
ncbi:TDP-N-acetylfucosamine:lipid II N-acetylfucosaminyltransferase [Anditalea andensis]|uniref:4-alpha-L-fucosyltransferase n=1 Tax=Anditalea andensis TaxID=1048983 RepID=A0A074KU05_9BACT|nr:TDP-N-acetylfucosamine:lipid II N-acetylfucosaminyltransferase [Anditalea andensis]KEO73461.1 hypothetical protein EL17_11170 [Anditalea andensis]